MRINKNTVRFLRMLYQCIRCNPNALVRVCDYDRVKEGQFLLGYYDTDYVYIRPQVFIPIFLAAYPDAGDYNIRPILEQLFALDMIKVHWIVSCDCRYRPQKRVGKTKRRYITFYRNRLSACFQYLRDLEDI